MNQFDNLLFELDTISSIKTGEKISIHGKHISIYPVSLFQSVIRLIYNENRNDMINKIDDIINTVILLGNEILTFLDCERIQKILLIKSKLKSAKKGIVNLQVTYANDPNIVASLIAIINNINSFIEKINKIKLT